MYHTAHYGLLVHLSAGQPLPSSQSPMMSSKATIHRSEHQPLLRQCSLQLVLIGLSSLLLLLGWCYVRIADQPTVPKVKDAVHFVRNGTQHEIDYLHRSHYLELMDLSEEGDQLIGNRSKAITMNETGQEQTAILHRRVKRGVLDLASMIKCVTGCNPFMYKDYGCYCGFQGDGYPVDGIDRCCFMHDHCYSRADCHQALVYFKSYKWACIGYGRAKCAYGSSSLCALQLCECDRKFAKCLTRYRCPHSKASCDIGKNLIIGK